MLESFLFNSNITIFQPMVLNTKTSQSTSMSTSPLPVILDMGMMSFHFTQFTRKKVEKNSG